MLHLSKTVYADYFEKHLKMMVGSKTYKAIFHFVILVHCMLVLGLILKIKEKKD